MESCKNLLGALSFSPPKSISFKFKRFLENESLGLLNDDYKKFFYSCKPILGGNLIDPPI
jgi:hypothetical protein